MPSTVSTILFGRSQTGHRPFVLLSLAIGVFATTFVGYALDVFYVSDGVAFIPYYAAVIGIVGAGAVGYSQNGVVFAWIVTYASLLGFHADFSFLGRSAQSFSQQLASFVHPDGLALLAVVGIILGTLALSLGYLAQGGVGFI